MATTPVHVPRWFDHDPVQGFDLYYGLVESVATYCDRMAKENQASIDKLRQDRHPEPEVIDRLEHEISVYEDILFLISDALAK